MWSIPCSTIMNDIFYACENDHNLVFIIVPLQCPFTCATKYFNEWEFHCVNDIGCCNPNLGFATKAKGLARGRNKWETRETHLILPGVQESVREWTLTLPRQLPLGELESRWTPEFSWNDFRGQNPLVYKNIYIIEKLLKRRRLKWARITHLDIWNTSYDQKKGRESNWQFDSQPLKVGNRFNFRACKWRATYYWKALNEGYNFVLNLISIGGLHKVIGPQNRRSSNFDNFKTPIWESRNKKPFGCGPHGEAQSIL
jgi:hypothetical protein